MAAQPLPFKSGAMSLPRFTMLHDTIAGDCSGCAGALRTAPPGVRVAMAATFLLLLGVALFGGTESQHAMGQVQGSATRHPAIGPGFDHEHRTWTAVLGDYVKDGAVDYRGLAAYGQPALNGYLEALRAASPGEATWTRDERLAFWVNAYNAFAIRLILDHYPLTSIRSIGFLPLAAFRMKFIPLGAARRPISLNTVENDILRTHFQDPRIHFAIVCASRSCPELRAEAYRASVVNDQLDTAARAFLGDRSKNRWDASSSTLYLSSIFKWFRDDFERHSQTLPAFASRYLPSSHAAALTDGSVRIVFLDYDWSLNGR